ncbi:MAG: LysR family transcriptional regulator [Reinekea sp.]|jgi:DNA-binding transcriptional LysR family regulator|nr:LysR family transcriptional regulator [Reinekea sp.]
MARRFEHLPDVEVFLTVAEQGSFTAAAVNLSTTPSVLSRAITRLETHLGCQLLRRTTRRLTLTDAGQEYLDQVRIAFGLIDSTERDLQGREGPLVGRVRLTAPTTYGHYRLPALLKRFTMQHPDVHLELNISNRNIDLNAEGYDLAIRLGPLPDRAIIGRKLEDARLCLVASPDYLQHHGVPQHLEDLQQHQCLRFMMPSTGRVTPWRLQVDGKFVDWLPQGGIQLSDDVLGTVSLAEQGLGIAQTLEFVAKDRLARGTLVPVLPQLAGATRPFSLLYAPHRHRTAASRALINSLLEPLHN